MFVLNLIVPLFMRNDFLYIDEELHHCIILPTVRVIAIIYMYISCSTFALFYL